MSTRNDLSPLFVKILIWIVPLLLGIISFFLVNVWNDIQDLKRGMNQLQIDQKELFIRLEHITDKVNELEQKPIN